MKKISEAWKTYFLHTTNASSVARQLAFAGIAVVWIFKMDAATIPDGLRIPLILFVLALALDLLQYVYLSFAWWRVAWGGERLFDSDDDLKNDREVEVPAYVNHPGVALWVLKITAVLFGYGMLLVNLFPLLFSGTTS